MSRKLQVKFLKSHFFSPGTLQRKPFERKQGVSRNKKQPSEKRYFLLKKADSTSLGVGYVVDDDAVYFTDDQLQRYENLHELIMETGALSFEWVPIIEPIPGALFTKPYGGLEGVTRSEGVMYLILKSVGNYVSRDVICQLMSDLVGPKESSL